MIPKLLITGGLGNLGSWVSEYFLGNTDWEIYITSSKYEKPAFTREYTLFSFDISSIEHMEFLRDYQFDYVIHLASNNNSSHPHYSTLAYEVNTLGTENLISVLDKTKIKNFIFFSTFHVYGGWREIYDETSICNPQNDYGNSHLLAEEIVKNSKLNHVIFRLSNSYGCPLLPSNSMWHLLFNDLCKMAYFNHELVFNSNGQGYRDFIWMGDVCEVIYRSLSNSEMKGIYNLSSGNSLKLLTIANEVKNAYKTWSNQEIKIKLNNSDTSLHTIYSVSNLKLSVDLEDFQFKNHFREEAIKIFTTLSHTDK